MLTLFLNPETLVMSNKNKQIRPSFTLEFKQSAAKLVNEKGYNQRQAADSLGVSLSALGQWLRDITHFYFLFFELLPT